MGQGPTFRLCSPRSHRWPLSPGGATGRHPTLYSYPPGHPSAPRLFAWGGTRGCEGSRGVQVYGGGCVGCVRVGGSLWGVYVWGVCVRCIHGGGLCGVCTHGGGLCGVSVVSQCLHTGVSASALTHSPPCTAPRGTLGNAVLRPPHTTGGCTLADYTSREAQRRGGQPMGARAGRRPGYIRRRPTRRAPVSPEQRRSEGAERRRQRHRVRPAPGSGGTASAAPCRGSAGSGCTRGGGWVLGGAPRGARG